MAQNDDDKPHIVYTHFKSQTTFVWDATSATVEVRPGGYEERVRDRFELKDYSPEGYTHEKFSFTPAQHFEYFKTLCNNYLKTQKQVKEAQLAAQSADDDF